MAERIDGRVRAWGEYSGFAGRLAFTRHSGYALAHHDLCTSKGCALSTALPPLTTPRLHIRPLVAADFDAVHAALNSAFGPTSEAERRDWLAWNIANEHTLASLGQPPYGERAIVRRDMGALIGAAGLVPAFGPFERLPSFQRRLGTPDTNRYTPEVGLFWGIHAAHQGRGYATEAARALMDAMFTQHHRQRIIATTEYDNAASMGVMRKLGMSIERNPQAEPGWFQVVGVRFNSQDLRS